MSKLFPFKSRLHLNYWNIRAKVILLHLVYNMDIKNINTYMKFEQNTLKRK